MSEVCRILLVDDDSDNCEMMSFLLGSEDERYEVFSANTADEALALIENKKFDLYILDSLMGDKSGVVLCGQIRHNDRRTPIMFYSGYEESGYIRKAMAAGANEYLVKPDELDKLPEKVREYVK